MFNTPLTAMVNAQDSFLVLIFRLAAVEVKIVIHKIYPVKHPVHCHKPVARLAIEPQHPTFSLSCDLVYIRAEACLPERVENVSFHKYLLNKLDITNPLS